MAGDNIYCKYCGLLTPRAPFCVHCGKRPEQDSHAS